MFAILKGNEIMKMIKKSIACIASAAMMLSGAGALTANAYITNYPNQFILTYAIGAPSTDIQTTLTNYASMGSSDPAITIQVTSCATSSNTKSCHFTVPLRASSEPYWTSFSYQWQTKDIALKSHGTNVYFTCELVRTDTSQGYGNCHFNGTAN